jgi:hypothetical protein
MDAEEISKEIAAIKERNKKVEIDKAWEISVTRRFSISIFTYIIATAWLLIIKDDKPFLKALLPVVGYVLSTFSLPFVKEWWSRQRRKAN